MVEELKAELERMKEKDVNGLALMDLKVDIEYENRQQARKEQQELKKKEKEEKKHKQKGEKRVKGQSKKSGLQNKSRFKYAGSDDSDEE